jgi:hypothetical protein
VIASRAHAAGGVVPDDTYPGVADGGQQPARVVGRCLVDDDDFELHLLLAQHAPERHREQGAPIARGDYHRYAQRASKVAR